MTPHERDSDDQPPCWHTEPTTPCDWDICRQPERLARGDRGTDPSRQHFQVTELRRAPQETT